MQEGRDCLTCSPAPPAVPALTHISPAAHCCSPLLTGLTGCTGRTEFGLAAGCGHRSSAPAMVGSLTNTGRSEIMQTADTALAAAAAATPGHHSRPDRVYSSVYWCLVYPRHPVGPRAGPGGPRATCVRCSLFVPATPTTRPSPQLTPQPRPRYHVSQV